jgi:hypothetical protein
MSKLSALVLIALAFLVVAVATSSARRDRDHDGLPDRWERLHDLSPSIKSGKGDPDRDGLTNLREYHLRTNPRNADTDGDGYDDRDEVHADTNPRDAASHPTTPPPPSPPDADGDGVPDSEDECPGEAGPASNDGCPVPPPPGDSDGDGVPDGSDQCPNTSPGTEVDEEGCPLPPPTPGDQFPNPATTGTPAGWVPAQVRSTDLTVTEDGAVVQDIRFTNGADLIVKGRNVTARRLEFQGGVITNQFGAAPANCGVGLLIEDVTFRQIPGQFEPSDYPVIGEGGYTARRVEIEHRGEGFRLSDCGPVTIEDSFALIKGADEGTAACNAVHSDGVQAVAGRGATLTNNTLIFETSCGTSPYFVVNPPVNPGDYDVDHMLVSGGGFVFRQQVPGSVTGLRIVDDSWVYGPISNACSKISSWEAKIVDVNSDYAVTNVVRNQPCNTEEIGG